MADMLAGNDEEYIDAVDADEADVADRDDDEVVVDPDIVAHENDEDLDVSPAKAPLDPEQRRQQLDMFMRNKPQKRVVIQLPAHHDAVDAVRDAAQMVAQRRARRRLADRILKTLAGHMSMQPKTGRLKDTTYSFAPDGAAAAAAAAAMHKLPTYGSRSDVASEEVANRDAAQTPKKPTFGGDGGDAAEDGSPAHEKFDEMKFAPDRDAARVPPLRERLGGDAPRQQYMRDRLLTIKAQLDSDDCQVKVSLYPSVAIVSSGRSVTSLPVVRRLNKPRAPAVSMTTGQALSRLGTLRHAEGDQNGQEEVDRGILRSSTGPGGRWSAPIGTDTPGPVDPVPSARVAISSEDREHLRRLRTAIRETTVQLEAEALQQVSPTSAAAAAEGGQRSRSNTKKRSKSDTRKAEAPDASKPTASRTPPQAQQQTSASATPGNTPPMVDENGFTVVAGSPKKGAVPSARPQYAVAAAVRARSASAGRTALGSGMQPVEDDNAAAAPTRSTFSGYSTFSSALYGDNTGFAPDDEWNTQSYGMDQQRRGMATTANAGDRTRQAFLASALGAGAALPRLKKGSPLPEGSMQSSLIPSASSTPATASVAALPGTLPIDPPPIGHPAAAAIEVADRRSPSPPNTMGGRSPMAGSTPGLPAATPQSASATPFMGGEASGTPASRVGLPKGPAGFSMAPKAREPVMLGLGGHLRDAEGGQGTNESPHHPVVASRRTGAGAATAHADPTVAGATSAWGAPAGARSDSTAVTASIEAAAAAANRQRAAPAGATAARAPPPSFSDVADPRESRVDRMWYGQIQRAREARGRRYRAIRVSLGGKALDEVGGEAHVPLLRAAPIPDEPEFTLEAGADDIPAEALDRRRDWLQQHLDWVTALCPTDRIAPRTSRYTELPSVPSVSSPEIALEIMCQRGVGPWYVFRESQFPIDMSQFTQQNDFEPRRFTPPVEPVEYNSVQQFVSRRPSAAGRKVNTHEFRVDVLHSTFEDIAVKSKDRYQSIASEMMDRVAFAETPAERGTLSMDAHEQRRRQTRVPATHPLVSDFVRVYPDRALENGIRPLVALEIEASRQATEFIALTQNIRRQRRYEVRSAKRRQAQAATASAQASGEFLGDDANLRAELRIGLRTADIARVQRLPQWALVEKRMEDLGEGAELPQYLKPPTVGSEPSELKPEAEWARVFRRWRERIDGLTEDNLENAFRPRTD